MWKLKIKTTDGKEIEFQFWSFFKGWVLSYLVLSIISVVFVVLFVFIMMSGT